MPIRRRDLILAAALCAAPAAAAELRAGAARVEIGDPTVPAHDPLYAKALVLSDGARTVALITVDAVAIGEIGRIPHSFLPEVRAALRAELNIAPENVLVNASHCHGVVARDVAQRTIRAVREAARALVPVRAAAGEGREDRIQENRRLRLRDGSEADARRAYALPPAEDVVGAGPIDPQIGLLRLTRADGSPLAVVYNFAVHPIQGVPDGRNTADLVGFASRTVEEGLGHGALALFLQGCGGDVNPVQYKDTTRPPDAEPLGRRLGQSVLEALRAMPPAGATADSRLALARRVLALPRADLAPHIAALEAREAALVKSLQPNPLNAQSFLDLYARYRVVPADPQDRFHAENRRQVALYLANLRTVDRLTRVRTNLALLRKHQAANRAAPAATIDVEVTALRIGDFVLLTFPGELTVQTGLDLKRASPHRFTFVAGYTNGYIYYAPTPEQLKNTGGAQEDSDCLLAPAWHGLFTSAAAGMLRGL